MTPSMRSGCAGRCEARWRLEGVRNVRRDAMKGRKGETERIRGANKAVAIVKLMDGRLRSWEEFLKPDADNIELISRKILKGAYHDVKDRVEKEIKAFCDANFVNMTQEKLIDIYEYVKEWRGLEMPLREFEEKFAKFRPNALASNPLHSTLRISLWGLGFEFPEKHLADDIETALVNAQKYESDLTIYQETAHEVNLSKRDDIARCIRQVKYNSRAVLLSCFNLVEAYFNSLAWEFVQKNENMSRLSKNDVDSLQDGGRVPIRDKMIKYPRIITGKQILFDNQDPMKSFLEIIKPYRDSLVHPSPFSAAERFGGYNKLRLMYRIHYDTALIAAHQSIAIIGETHRVVSADQNIYPDWLQGLLKVLQIKQA